MYLKNTILKSETKENGKMLTSESRVLQVFIPSLFPISVGLKFF